MALRELIPQVLMTEKGSEKCLSSFQTHDRTFVTQAVRSDPDRAVR